MDLIVTTLIAGVVGTIMMDLFNYIFARSGIIGKIEVEMIGRMVLAWAQGRFRFGLAGELESVANEKMTGYITHYAVGVGLALPYLIGWNLLIGTPASTLWAIVYGVATTVASHFFVLPAMGLGVFGRKSSEGLKPAFSSLANHLFYGVGLALGIGLVQIL